MGVTYFSILTFWAAAPKGPMTYAFTHGEISPPPSPPPAYPPSPQPPCSFLSLEAHIPASRSKSQS